MAELALAELADCDRETIEAWLVTFDTAWQEDTLAEWVTSRLPKNHPLRPLALAEMVAIDLEHHWQRGNCLSLEAYLEKYPELGDTATVSVDLILAEYQLRQQFGVSVDLQDFARRFPRQAAELARRVQQSAVTPFDAPLSHELPLVSAERDTSQTGPSADTVPPARKALHDLPEQFGRYHIVKKIGAGGMGSVYLAHDTQLDRHVALKVPHFSAQEGQQAVERFLREARAAATIQHANLCPVYDAGQIDGVHYLTMAYIEGHLLSEYIRPAKPAAERKAALVVRTAALALHEAHARGIVHRDLKPTNIMINPRGEPVIMDFGLARREQSTDVVLTQDGAVMGTPAYMSPEQARGQSEAVGPSSDIYSLGVILYELLTSRRPFTGELLRVLSQISTVEPARPAQLRPGLDPQLEEICLKAMAKRLEDRYSTMGDFAAALNESLKRTSQHAASVEATPLVGSETPQAKAAGQTPPDQCSDRELPDVCPATLPPPPPRHVAGAPSVRLIPRGPRHARARDRVSVLQKLVPLWKQGRYRLAALATLPLLALLLWGAIVTLRTPVGMLIVEIDDPAATVQVLSEEGKVLVERKGEKGKLTIGVDPGKRRLRVEKDGLVLFTQDFTIASGGKETIRARLDPGGVRETQREESSAAPIPRQPAAQDTATIRTKTSDVFQHSLMTPDVLDRFYCCSGQYSGPWGRWLWAEVKIGEGVKLWGGHTPTALWAPVAVGGTYHVSLESRFRKDAFCPARVLLSGPGYGNSLESSYCVVLDGKTVILLREGVEQCRAALGSPTPFDEWFQMEADVDAGHVVVRVDEALVLDFTDPQPLAGPLHAWIGFTGAGPRQGETWFRNLRISGPGLSEDAAKELLPPVTAAPLPNGPSVYELAINHPTLDKDWWLSLPEAVNVGDGSLDLRGVNAVSQLLLDRPLQGNVALEVEMEYPTHEALNFSLALWTADALPRELNSRAGGWLLWLPNGGSMSQLQWHGGPDQLGWPWASKSEILAQTPYHVPIRNRRYVVRLEAVGDRARVFLDGRLLFEGQRPADAPGKDLPFYAAIGQIYAPVTVYRVSIYRLDQVSAIPAGAAADPTRGTERTGERARFSREENFRKTWHDFVPVRNYLTGSGARLEWPGAI